METLKQEHRDILSKVGDFTNNLKLVTNTLPSEAYFTSIEIGTDEITVGGEADNPFTIISYVLALGAQGGLSEVRIAQIGESEITEAESSGVSFTIVITKWE